jgi:hypothetical protein
MELTVVEKVLVLAEQAVQQVQQYQTMEVLQHHKFR